VDHSIITITKRSAARHEIDGAIRALADHRNFIAAELLASAAIDVISGVSRQSDVETFTAKFEKAIKPEHLKEATKVARKPYNFLKHSDRDRDTAIDRYRTDTALFRIFIAIIDFESCWRTKSLPMFIYLSWFLSRNPGLLKEEHHDLIDHFNQNYGDMSQVTEDHALKTLKAVFAQYDAAGDIVEQRLRANVQNVEI
jgi:hypothetical protein